MIDRRATETATAASGRDLGGYDDYIEAEVRDLVGERLGAVEDVVVDPVTHRIRYAVLRFGGVLGLGEALHPVPWRLLRWRADGAAELRLSDADKTSGDLGAAPGVPRAAWRPELVDDPSLAPRLGTYYGTHAI